MEALYNPIPSPLQLDRYFLKGLHFELKNGYDRRGPRKRGFDAPALQIGVVSAEQDDENPFQWRFEVSLELPHLPDSEFPYHVATTLVGYFTVDQKYPAELAERLARVNGPAVLYSCAREIVATVTGRSPYPKLLIPSVTFLQPEIAANNEELALAAVGESHQLIGESEENPSPDAA